MVIGVHNCTGSPEHSSLDKVITAPKSRAGNVCAIYASTEGTAESAYLRRLAWASALNNAISTKISRAGPNGDWSATYMGSAYLEICDILKYLVISQNRIRDITKYNL